MNDSWCSEIWDGQQWLYGAAAREYRLARAGGVDAVVRRTADRAAREALAEVDDLIQQAQRTNKVVALNRRRSRSLK